MRAQTVGTVAAGLVVGWLAYAGREWAAVRGSPGGRDYASYHAAVQVAVAGGDPYDTPALTAALRADNARKAAVHPYFYPPPFLLAALWSWPLSLHGAYQAWFWMCELSGLAAITVLTRRFGVPLALAVAVAALFAPFHESARMGQANHIVLLLLALGVARGVPTAQAGLLVGAAAMMKMSPALLLFGYGALGRWRPVLAAVGTAIGLTLLALPLVGPLAQWRFYTEVLPSFSSGAYHGLTVPIRIAFNHSIPDAWLALWPGPDAHTLSASARAAAGLTTFGLLGAVLTRGRRAAGHPLAEANLLGALVVLFTLTPVYAYEHHLAIVVLPVLVAAAALAARPGARAGWVAWGSLTAILALPLEALRALAAALGPAAAVAHELKFAALLGLLALCAALAAPPAAPARTEATP